MEWPGWDFVHFVWPQGPDAAPRLSFTKSARADRHDGLDVRDRNLDHRKSFRSEIWRPSSQVWPDTPGEVPACALYSRFHPYCAFVLTGGGWSAGNARILSASSFCVNPRSRWMGTSAGRGVSALAGSGIRFNFEGLAQPSKLMRTWSARVRERRLRRSDFKEDGSWFCNDAPPPSMQAYAYQNIPGRNQLGEGSTGKSLGRGRHRFSEQSATGTGSPPATASNRFGSRRVAS
jgi:hypothetical protein